METNNNTLGKDINLIERENGYWDYEFQYGDIVHTKNKQSLRNGLIIACLTSWNYLNRQQNPTYTEFGNKAYWELKKKKSTMVEYTIKQYFIEVLNRIRRVHRVIDIQILDTKTDPNAYDIVFTVEAINDEIITGKFNINTEKDLSTTYLTITQDNTVCTPNKPVTFHITINTEYGNSIQDDIIYAYRVLEDNIEEYIGAYHTNKPVHIQALPKFNKEKIRFKYWGNELFNGCETQETYDVMSVPFYFTINEKNNLIMIKHPETTIKAWLGEIVQYTTEMVYDEDNPRQYYLIPDNETDNDYYKYHYENGEYHREPDKVYHLINKPNDINNGDIRLFIEDLNGELTVIGKLHMENNHIYYDL